MSPTIRKELRKQRVVPVNIIEKAISMACKSNVIRGKIGAVLYSESGHIIAASCNSSFYGSDRIKTIHAEEALLYKAYKINATHRYGSNLNVLVIRWTPGTKKLQIAKPCVNCHKSLKQTNFNVYYSDYLGDIQKLIFD